MKAALYSKAHTFDIKDIDSIKPQSGEVKIKVEYCGICGTDLHIFHGLMDKRVNAPQPIGHEMSGTITEVGEDVDNINVGDRITVRPLDWCGKCPACKAGHKHICENLKFMGIDSVGAFQEEWIVKARTIHKIPKALSFKHAAMIEPLAVACHDVRLGSVKKGDNVVVLGGGPIGLLISMVAKAAGANIIISEISDYRLSLAQKMGFKTVNPKESDIKEEVMKFTNNVGADVVFEVTATAICAKLMTELPRTRGTMVTVGIFSEPPQIDLFKFFWRELQLKGARVYEEEDFDKAIALAAEGSINFEELISGVYDLDNITDAFKSLEGNATAMKVVVKCS